MPFDENSGMAALNAGANGLTAASLNAYGTLPNPQLAAESLSTGAAPDVVSAYSQMDPKQLAHLLSANPLGVQERSPAPPRAAPIHEADPYSMSPDAWKQYEQRVAIMKDDKLPPFARDALLEKYGKPDDARWKSLGVIPIANLDWVRSVQQSDGGTVKKFQSFLNQNGFAGTDVNGRPTHLGVSGTWDAGTDAAFKSFLYARFAPDALFSKDSQTQSRAQAFLGGIGMDTQKLLQSESRTNPQFRKDVYLAWLGAMGGDRGGKDSIGHYVDQYGLDSVPQEIRDLQGNWLTNAFDTIKQLMPQAPEQKVMGAFAGDKKLGALQQGEAGKGKTAQQQAIENIDKNYTAAEKDVLAKSLQQAHDQSGYLGFLSDFDRFRTKKILSVKYYFQDAVVGSHNWTQNPFDDTSEAGHQAAAHEGNMMAGILGDQIGNLPVLNQLGNMAANIFDDPLTYTAVGLEEKGLVSARRLGELVGDVSGVKLAKPIATTTEKPSAVMSLLKGKPSTALLSGRDRSPFVTRTEAARLINAIPDADQKERLAAMLSSGEIMGKKLTFNAGGAQRTSLMTPTTIRDNFRAGTLKSHLMATMTNPKMAARQEYARVLPGVSLHGAVKLMGLTGEHGATLIDIVKQIQKEENPVLRESLLQEHFGEMLHSPDFAFNFAQQRKIYTSQAWERLNPSQQASLLTRSNRAGIDKGIVNHTSDPLALADTLDSTGHTLDMDESVLAPIIEKAYSPDKAIRHQATVDFYREALAAAKKKFGPRYAQFTQHLEMLRGRTFSEPDESQATMLPMRDPATGAIKEASTVAVKAGYEHSDPVVAHMLNQAAEEFRAMAAAAAKDHEDTMRIAVDNLMHDEGRPDNAHEWQRAAAEWEAGEEGQASRQLMENRQAAVNEQLRGLETVPGAKKHGADAIIPTPASSGQFKVWYHLPFTKYEILHFESRSLRGAEWLQKKVRADQATAFWKNLVLFKPSSTLRIVGGDETGRAVINDFLDGGPTMAARTIRKLFRKTNGEFPIPEDLKTGVRNLLTGLHLDAHLPFSPGSLGYEKNLRHSIEKLHSDGPEARAWVDAMDKKADQKLAIDKLTEWVQTDAPEAVEFRRIHKITDPEGARRWAVGQDQNFRAIVRYNPAHPDGLYLFNSFKAAVRGEARSDPKAFSEFVKRNRNNEDVLPIVVGRRPYADATKHDGRRAGAFFTPHGFHDLTDALINNQRQNIYSSKVEQYIPEVKRHHPTWTEPQVHERAGMMASQWVKRNTYQMERSLAGTALRNVMPFYGATANFNKFVMRQFAKHPWVINPAGELLDQISAKQKSGGFELPLPGSGALLSKIGATSGDNITFDPMHAFFFTAEGYAGFMPGFGPVVMTPLKHFAANNPDLADTLKQIPGFEYVDTQSAPFPAVERVISGVGMLALGHDPLQGVPLIGTPGGSTDAAVLKEERKEHAAFLEAGGQGEDASPDRAKAVVAKEKIIGGALGAALPINPTVTDARTQQIQPALKAWDATTTDAERDQVIASFPDAAPLLRSFDARTSRDEKQQILADHPWVGPYSTGATASASSATPTGTEVSAAAYKQDIAKGNLRYLGDQEFIDKMNRYDAINAGWSQYTFEQQRYEAFMAANGIDATDPAAKQYKQYVLDPAIASLSAENKPWGDAFGHPASRDATGLQDATRELRSLMSWEVIPRHGSAETSTTLAWRQAVVWRDEAASALRIAQDNHRPLAEQETIMNNLALLYAGLAQQDPGFASQIQRFSYSKVKDLIDLEALGLKQVEGPPQ